ncbi:MAG TPA: Gfo/Idh/MocA family oxidoreductase [Gemmataceae bacterium]|nr:Gfo/Idh/MocA family oxidoreductase [Gemmataceae bacterium]
MDGSIGVTLRRRTFMQGTAAALLTAAGYQRVRGANERIGVGFIGYGLIGKRHVLDFKEQADVEPIAVAEAHNGRLDEAKTLLGGSVQGHRDFRKLLEDRRVDAVVVSTPDHWHALMTMLACAAGKDVYVEKPLTLFVREGRWMVEVARRQRRIVQVGTQQRSGGHYQKARELIRAGHLGQVFSVRMQAYRNIMPGYGRPADQEPPRELDWDLWLGPAPKRRYNPNRALYHFRWFWDYSGGQMTNLGQHALDIAYWYLDAKAPRSVASMGGRFCLQDNGETPDTQDVLFEHIGWTAVWSHREACKGPLSAAPLEFFGSLGSLAISRTGFTIMADRKLPPENSVPEFAGAHPAGGPAAVKETGPPQFWTKAIVDKTGDSRAQLKQHVRNFLDCVKSRKEPISDLESGHRVATACHLANLSLRLGRRLRWDADKETILDDPEAAKLLVRPYRAPWDAELKALGVG